MDPDQVLLLCDVAPDQAALIDHAALDRTSLLDIVAPCQSMPPYEKASSLSDPCAGL